MEYKDPGRYIPVIYLLYSWGSRFGVPSRVPLLQASCTLNDFLDNGGWPLLVLGYYRMENHMENGSLDGKWFM